MKLMGQNGRDYVKAHFERRVLAEKMAIVIEGMGKK
jgi:hypothetical protein